VETSTARVPGGALPPAADPDQLRRLLLTGPDRLDSETAAYCLQAGLGILLPIG
jgi:hypothetical protein